MEMQKKLVSKASKWKIIVLSTLWKTKRVTFVKTGKIQGILQNFSVVNPKCEICIYSMHPNLEMWVCGMKTIQLIFFHTLQQ